ncbi:MAG: WecB/TagA/CpsF family glycosyltransferase [Deltaproteobacteria bacterium]|nr:WecB/TagA/CpsF family glycosyltransferase [Deltaproteobacteria bacterium]
MEEAVAGIEENIRKDAGVFVTLTGVHGIMESQYDEQVKRIHSEAAMCLPDGMPTVWVGRVYGHGNMRRICGPDLMLEIMKISVAKGYTHFFYGGKQGVPELLKERLVSRFPGLKIVGTLSPPFRPLTEQEEIEFKELIESLRPDIIWVGLSTPKQEKWMFEHSGKLNARVMIGVGAAFDFHAGLLKRAPHWMQQLGLEWFFRLCVEPGRLWRRYLYNNPRFVWLILRQIIREKEFIHIVE